MKLPYVTESLEGVGGHIRERMEHFIVDEVLLYEPDSHGSHIFVNLTREGLSTRDLVHRLASLFKVRRYDVGYAGLKDKYSRATQTFSILMHGSTDDPLNHIIELIESEIPVKVNWVSANRRKLRVGHLLGNRFTITITGMEISNYEALDRAQKIAAMIRENGLPNYYGPQRLGDEGKNLRRGLEIIQGKRHFRRGWLRRYLISCYLSHLCNSYLASRVESGAFYHVIKGDIAKKHSTGGLFIVEDEEREQERYLNHEISFTAPIFGPKMWRASGPSGEVEEQIWMESEITLEQLKRLKVRGSRRLGRILPNINVSETSEGIVVRFFLPKGAFATTVLREIMKSDLY